MPTRVYNNVEGFRFLNDGRTTEDVTSVTLPTIKHPTSTISNSGMPIDVEMPDNGRLEPMEFSVSHNNGVNCRHLSSPGKHFLELRTARQRYNVPDGAIEYEPTRYRITGMHKETDEGSVELGNPNGSTDKYSVLRYEKEVDGVVVTVLDAMAGKIKINGVDHTSVIENMLK